MRNINPYGGASRREQGLKPSVARLINLIDTSDESFPKVVEVLSEMAGAGVDLDEAAVSIALKMAATRAALLPKQPQPDLGLPLWTSTGDKQSIVYYIRRGELIKIGTTTRPIKRFETLLPDEILAFEPGDRTVEAARHRQFHHLQQGVGEHFAQADDLTRHVKRLRALHGEPDPAWRTTANIHMTTRHPSLPRLLAPLSLETATIPEASKRLGVRTVTLYGWARRGKLPRVGLNDRGHPVYYIEHFETLANRLAASPWKKVGPTGPCEEDRPDSTDLDRAV